MKTNTSILNNTPAKPKTNLQKQLEELDATFEYALMKRQQSVKSNYQQLNRSSFTEVDLRGLGKIKETVADNSRDVSLVQMDVTFTDQVAFDAPNKFYRSSLLNDTQESSHYMAEVKP